MAVRRFDPKDPELYSSGKCSFQKRLKYRRPIVLRVCRAIYEKICHRCNLAFCAQHATPVMHSCGAPRAHFERKNRR